MFGIFELDTEGTVLYSRPRTDGKLDLTSPVSAIGQNFFHDVANFENRDELRQLFRNFVAGNTPADTHTFNCIVGSETVRARVLITKGYAKDNGQREGVVILDIRQAAD